MRNMCDPRSEMWWWLAGVRMEFLRWIFSVRASAPAWQWPRWHHRSSPHSTRDSSAPSCECCRWWRSSCCSDRSPCRWCCSSEAFRSWLTACWRGFDPPRRSFPWRPLADATGTESVRDLEDGRIRCFAVTTSKSQTMFGLPALPFVTFDPGDSLGVLIRFLACFSHVEHGWNGERVSAWMRFGRYCGSTIHNDPFPRFYNDQNCQSTFRRFKL